MSDGTATEFAIRRTVTVQASQERAFRVFTERQSGWWPRTHSIASQPLQDAVIEPRAGGRWYERAADGSECDWGHVRVWDPPARIVLVWQITGEWAYDAALDTELEVRFVAEGPARTRVELEHRQLDAYDEQTRGMLDSPGGWGGVLERFAAATRDDVRVDVAVAAPPEHAFAVFTQRCDDWWPRSYRLGKGERIDTQIEPRLGGRWYERTDAGEVDSWGEVLAWDPPRHIALSWQITPQFKPEPDAARASRVDVHFAPDGPDRTAVALLHAEIERHGEAWEDMHAALGADRSWPGIMRAYAELAGTTHTP